MFKMDRNSSYQHSTNFIFARNPAYGTSISMAPKIETEENAAYHCDIAISSWAKPIISHAWHNSTHKFQLNGGAESVEQVLE